MRVVCVMPPPPRSTLLPYTTLFRSLRRAVVERPAAEDPFTALRRVMEEEAGRRILDADRFLRRMRLLRQEPQLDRKSTRLNSSHMSSSYAVLCLKKKRNKTQSSPPH